LEEYVDSLLGATNTPYADYLNIGIKDSSGEYKQLNANILQIENEYYSNIRPKQIAKSGERPSLALRERGVKYVELRSVDINPFEPTGICEQQLLFLEAFMIFCLLIDSPTLSIKEKNCVDKNLTLVATNGRSPELQLHRDEERISLKEWGMEICQAMKELCAILDADDESRPYTSSLHAQIAKLHDADLTPSARILQKMEKQELPFFKFALQHSQAHKATFEQQPLTSEQQSYFEKTATQSTEDQKKLENSDAIDFDKFLANYFSQS